MTMSDSPTFPRRYDRAGSGSSPERDLRDVMRHQYPGHPYPELLAVLAPLLSDVDAPLHSAAHRFVSERQHGTGLSSPAEERRWPQEARQLMARAGKRVNEPLVAAVARDVGAGRFDAERDYLGINGAKETPPPDNTLARPEDFARKPSRPAPGRRKVERTDTGAVRLSNEVERDRPRPVRRTRTVVGPDADGIIRSHEIDL